jgi:hypothetical protein
MFDSHTSTEINSIWKANLICFSVHAADTRHAAVQGFIHANGKKSRGIVALWLEDPSFGDIDWFSVRDTCGKTYTAHQIIQQLLTNPLHINYLKQQEFNNCRLPLKVLWECVCLKVLIFKC